MADGDKGENDGKRYGGAEITDDLRGEQFQGN